MDRSFDEPEAIVRNPTGGVCTERTTAGGADRYYRGRPGRLPGPTNSPVKREAGGRL